jgi:2-C-methyl-D-erythritol 4-phosphate cytidylyltransferase
MVDSTASASTAGSCAVLVPAAGQGTRLGGRRKQYRTLGGHPVLVQTLLAFERHPRIDHIIVAAPSGQISPLADQLQAAGIGTLTAVVEGGATRQASVRNALRAVPAPADTVLVHDAVRPFVRAADIAAVVDAVEQAGAAALALPVADTLRQGESDRFGATVPRDGVYRMQTPQGFRRDWLEAAHAEAKPDAATDDVGLVQALGRAVQIVEGHAHNFKITTPDDWTLAQRLWPHWAETQQIAGAAGSADASVSDA